jgi:predicted nucleotidyltransferase
MELASLRRIVAQWAACQPLVLRAWIFGSRARGTSRSDSDVDVAIEVRALRGDSGPLVTFIFEKDKLKRSLEAALLIDVDLQWYGGPTETPTTHAGLKRSSVLVYQVDENLRRASE